MLQRPIAKENQVFLKRKKNVLKKNKFQVLI